MSTEQAFLALLALGCVFNESAATEIYTAVNRLREDMQKLEVKLSSEYVRYDRLQDALKPILSGIEEIKQALTHKVDK